MITTPYLQLFLWATLRLIADGNKEEYTFVEDNISKGIATALFNKYEKEYSKFGVQRDFLYEIDSFYKEIYAGVGDGNEGKYKCEEDDGLLLIIALILNNITI